MAENDKQDATGFRFWLRKRAMMITLYAGAVGAVLTTAVAWNQLDLPRPATSEEVRDVWQYAMDTRQIVTNQEWFRLSAKLKIARAKLRLDPTNRELIDEVTRLEQAIKEVDDQLNALKRDRGR